MRPNHGGLFVLFVIILTQTASLATGQTHAVGPPTIDQAPIDASGAVGPNHLVSLTNYEFTVQDRVGAVKKRVTLKDFWAAMLQGPLSSPFDPFDPRVTWNPHIDRFVAVSVVGEKSVADENGRMNPSAELLIGISKSPDPTGAWQGDRYAVGPTEWLDFPNLGFNRRWTAIQADLQRRSDVSRGIEHHSLASRIYVFENAELGTANPVPQTIDRPADPDDWIGYEIPASNYDPNDDLHFVQANFGNDRGRGWLMTYRLRELNGQITFDPWEEVGSQQHRWTNTPPSTQLLPQKDWPTFIQTSGDYVQSAIQRNGSIWAVHTTYLPVGIGARSAVQWWEIGVGGANPTLVQSGQVDDPRAGNDSRGQFYSYPSIGVNQRNDAVIGFGIHATDIFASAGFAVRKSTDPIGQIGKAQLQQMGGGVYEDGDRWSDYTSTVPDPNDNSIWTLQVVSAAPDPTTGDRRVQLFWINVKP